MPEFYDRHLGPAIFAPYAEYLSGLAATHASESVLELAAGSGVLTTQLVRSLPAAEIVATDLNPAMVSWAEQRVSGPSWRTADASSLTFPDACFDLLVCQFGVMFFPDKVGAFRQAARVLRPGGVYLFTVWDTVETSGFTAALVAALAEVLPENPPDFVVRVPHGYREPDQIRRDVVAGGLDVDGIDRVVLRGASPSAHALAQGFCLGTPLRFALQDRGDLEQLTQAVGEHMTGSLGAGPVESELTALVVTARRPRR